jgi:ribonuclease P/MRP protein subunit POP3
MPASTNEHETTEKVNDDLRPVSMVLITHPKPSTSIAHAHFPTLVHLSTLNSAPDPNTTRLVPLATSADARLSSALHIPRIGALAILANAPGAKALEDFVREKVDTTSCPWIDEAMAAQWRGVNVKSETSFVVRTKGKGTT